MVATHKLSNSHITVSGRLSADRLAELAHYVAENAGSTAKIRFEGSQAGTISYSIRSWVGASMMTFDVHITNQGDCSSAKSKIDMFKTTQQTMFFIPVTPKQLLGYSMYKRFMEGLALAVRAEDPNADVQIIQQPQFV
ncbi:hypothetical protein B2J88_06330 [Rhodococcus sp. SRB_17]|nr:hypothetical protein [Rhodococcus sp. SRB_17]